MESMWKGSECRMFWFSLEHSDPTTLKGVTELADMATREEACSCFQCCTQHSHRGCTESSTDGT